VLHIEGDFEMAGVSACAPDRCAHRVAGVRDPAATRRTGRCLLGAL